MLANKAQKELFAVQSGIRAAMVGSLGLRILSNEAYDAGYDPATAMPLLDKLEAALKDAWKAEKAIHAAIEELGGGTTPAPRRSG